jgi:hypothetical protein
MAIDLYELAVRYKSEGFKAVANQMDAMDKRGKGLAARFGAVQKAITGVAAAGAVVAAGKFLSQAISEAAEAERVLGELRQSVNNAGGDFQRLAPDLDAAANRMAKFTRFSDDAARGALTRMVQISGDTKGALDNLGLAADIAAAKHISLEDAAKIVGKTMSGNVRGLKEFGITTKDSAEAMEQLRQKFRGMAEGDAATLQGRLEQVRNAWGEVLEAAGKVLTGADGIPNQLVIIRDRLIDLSTWIDTNADKWRSWGTRVSQYVKGVEDRMARLQGIAFAINRFFGGNAQASNGAGSRGGGGGGGRDAGTPGFVSPSTPWGGGGFGGLRGGLFGQGHSTPGGGAGGTGGGSSSGPRIPVFNMPDFNLPQTQFDENPFDTGGFSQVGMTPDQLGELFEQHNEKIAESRKKTEQELAEYQQMIQERGNMMAVTLGDAIQNGIIAAFEGKGVSGAIAAFGKTILAGLGDMMVQKGTAMIAEGAIMAGLIPFLANPFTSGPALLAAGASLVALGSTLGAIATGGPRGASRSGGFRDNVNGTSDIVRLKFVDRPGMAASLSPAQPLVFNVIGPNDPAAQRAIGEIVRKGGRR